MQTWTGYVELTRDRGLVRCDIMPSDDGYVAVYVDDDLADDVDDRQYFAKEYGDRFFATLADYRADKALNLDQVWPKE